MRALGALILLSVAVLVVMRWVDPPTTPYIWQEQTRLGEIRRDWRGLDEMAPAIARSAVAAEDANFCVHWGIDMTAIRLALEEGANRGASTITQQVVKNVFLWHGRSWSRKALEALITPLVEIAWTKRRILEVYLNVAEFDEGVFGVEAASHWYFGVAAEHLSARQAAQLVAVLPAPKNRSARKPSKRSEAIRDGAATIAGDGRAQCFED